MLPVIELTGAKVTDHNILVLGNEKYILSFETKRWKRKSWFFVTVPYIIRGWYTLISGLFCAASSSVEPPSHRAPVSPMLTVFTSSKSPVKGVYQFWNCKCISIKVGLYCIHVNYAYTHMYIACTMIMQYFPTNYTTIILLFTTSSILNIAK